MELFNEIKKLGLSVDQYVVIGGASMMARGIKETADIDLVVAPELFEREQKNGWIEHLRPNGEPGFEKGVFEMYLDVNAGNFNPTFAELRAQADIIDGIPFCSLEDVMRFKREYKRDKDFKDIELIEQYQKSLL